MTARPTIPLRHSGPDPETSPQTAPRSDRVGTGKPFIALDQAEALLVRITLHDALIDLDRLLIGKTAEQIASVEPFRQSLTTLRNRVDLHFAQARAKGIA